MAQNNDIERRYVLQAADVDDNGHVSGYAAVFNSLSEDLGGFREVITDKALIGVIEQSDVFAVLNHNPDRGVLARSRNGIGTLKLGLDATGLHYEFDVPNTALGAEVVESIKRGDISGSSFAFSVEKDEWSKDYQLRTITKIRRLYDVSPVYTPAYTETSAAVRSMCIARELAQYFAELRNRLK